jgi:fatty acid desaturase
MLRIALQIFPLLQGLFFIASINIYKAYNIWALVLLFASALLMNFSLHITVHHYVHFRFRPKWLDRIFELLNTLIIGMPFGFYRMQHLNHHRHNNLIGDFTSTWKQKNEEIVASNHITYSFLWFFNSTVKKSIQQAKSEGDLSQERQLRMKIELVFLTIFYGVLFYLNPIFALAYFGLFYFGWCFIATSNFGQHLPLVYGQTVGHSFYNKFYNWLFFNNGLHYEHHAHPDLDYPDLKAEYNSKVSWPHLFMGLFNRKK